MCIDRLVPVAVYEMKCALMVYVAASVTLTNKRTKEQRNEGTKEQTDKQTEPASRPGVGPPNALPPRPCIILK